MIRLIRTPAHWHLHWRGVGGLFLVFNSPAGRYGLGINRLRGRRIGTRWIFIGRGGVNLIGWRR